MSDPNELLRLIRARRAGIKNDFDALDTHCKAGNLPDEWRTRSETAMQASERQHSEERIAALDAEQVEPTETKEADHG